MQLLARLVSVPFLGAIAAGLLLTLPWHSLFAAGESGGHVAPLTFLWIAAILLFAKMSSLIERWRQPSVLGELLVGVVLGNVALLGIGVFEPIKSDSIIAFLAELGVIVLLFQIGLESNVKQMGSVGVRALCVAVVGVLVPFVLGAYVVGPLLLPGLDTVAYLFLGAALTATSVGITARVFKDAGVLASRESQIVLGAAVIDDVLGLIILAVVSAIATAGFITAGSVAIIFLKAVGFLGAAIFLGQRLAPRLSLAFSKINTGIGMKFTLAFSLGLIFAWGAGVMGLAPIVGAFAAGLVLDSVVFRYFRRSEMAEDLEYALRDVDERSRARVEGVVQRQNVKHVDELIEPLAFFLVPIFFVHVGMQVDLATFANLSILLTGLGITVVACLGKLIAGYVSGKGVDSLVVGLGMVPRGEVGLIFATVGASLGVINSAVFSVIIIMVILTTVITPPLLAFLLRRNSIVTAK